MAQHLTHFPFAREAVEKIVGHRFPNPFSSIFSNDEKLSNIIIDVVIFIELFDHREPRYLTIYSDHEWMTLTISRPPLEVQIEWNDDILSIANLFQFIGRASCPPIFWKIITASEQATFRALPTHDFRHVVDIEVDEILHDRKIIFSCLYHFNLHDRFCLRPK